MVKESVRVLFLFICTIFITVLLAGFASAACSAMTPSIDIVPSDINRPNFPSTDNYYYSITVTNNDFGSTCSSKTITLQIESCTNPWPGGPDPYNTHCYLNNQESVSYPVSLSAGGSQTLTNILKIYTRDTPGTRISGVIKAYDTSNTVRESAVLWTTDTFLGEYGFINPTFTTIPSGKSGIGTQTFSFSLKHNTPGDNSITYSITPICPSGWTCTSNPSSLSMNLGQTKSFIISATPPTTADIGTYPIFVQVRGNTGHYVNIWQLSPKTTYTYTGETNCNNFIDDDGDGYIDYADSNCISSCVNPNIITGRISGRGNGTAWSPTNMTPNIAECCAAGQCLDIAPGSNTCVASGTTRTIAPYSFVCSASGSSAFWCKQGYSNDGNGNCVGGDEGIAQSTFTGLNSCFAPSAAFYHGFNGKRISLWNLTNILYESSNGTSFSKISRSSLVAKGIPSAFQPTLGIYYNISGSSGEILLFNSSGDAYKTSSGNDNTWSSYNKASKGLPADFKPISGRHMILPLNIAELTNASNTPYRLSTSSGSWNDATAAYTAPQYSNYPMGNSPLITYYYNISGNEHNAYWLNVSGMLKVYQYTWAYYDSFQEITSMLAGLPPLDQMPTEGYFDPIRKKIVIWYGNEAYESENNIYFKKINLPICRTGPEEQMPGLRTCNDIINQTICEYYSDSNNLTDSMKSSIQEKSLIKNNFCFDPIYTFEPDSANGGVSGDPATCGTYIACGCYWDVINSKCEEKTFNAVTNPGLCISTIATLSNCKITTDSLIGSCSDNGGEYLIKWNASWEDGGENPDQGCVSGEKILPCPTASNLSFFNLFNIAISIILIGIIYLIIIKRES